MKNEKEDSSYITTITDFTTTTSSSDYIITVPTSANNIDTANCVIVSNDNDLYTYSIDPYLEAEEIKQQQEKEEELREENPCLQKAWNEYQLILKLLEENECDKFLEKKYGINK